MKDKTLNGNFPVAFKFSERLSGLVNHNPRWNGVNHTSRHHLELSLLQCFGLHNKHVLSVCGKIPLTDESLTWKGNIAPTWFFNRKFSSPSHGF